MVAYYLDDLLTAVDLTDESATGDNIEGSTHHVLRSTSLLDEGNPGWKICSLVEEAKEHDIVVVINRVEVSWPVCK